MALLQNARCCLSLQEVRDSNVDRPLHRADQVSVPPNKFRTSATFPLLRDPFTIPVPAPKALPRSKTWRSVPENRPPIAKTDVLGQALDAGIKVIEAEVHPVHPIQAPRSLPHKGKLIVTDLRRSFEAGVSLQRATPLDAGSRHQGSPGQTRGLRDAQLGEVQKVPISDAKVSEEKQHRDRGRGKQIDHEETPTSPRGSSSMASPRQNGGRGLARRIPHSLTTPSAFLSTKAGKVDTLSQATSTHESRPSVADLRKVFDAAEPAMQGSGLFKVLYNRRQTAPNLSKHLDGPADVKKSEGWRVFRDASASYAQRSKSKLQKRRKPSTESGTGTPSTWRASLTSRLHSLGSGSVTIHGPGTGDTRRLGSIQEAPNPVDRKLETSVQTDPGGPGMATSPPTSGKTLSRARRSTYDGAAEGSSHAKNEHSTGERRTLSRSLKDKAGAWFTSRKSSRQSSNTSTSNDVEGHTLTKQRVPWSGLNVDGCYEVSSSGRAPDPTQNARGTMISRVRALQRAFRNSETHASPAPAPTSPEPQHMGLYPTDGVLVAHATCGMHHPRPTRPVRLSSMKRIVSLRKSRDASEPTVQGE